MSRGRGLRKITIEGTVFHWKAEWFYIGWDRIIMMKAWGGDKTSRPLEVLLSSPTAAAWPLRHAFDTESSYVLPHQVRTIILCALEHGWLPHTRGQPYYLEMGAAVDLGNLTVVDIENGLMQGL